MPECQMLKIKFFWRWYKNGTLNRAIMILSKNKQGRETLTQNAVAYAAAFFYGLVGVVVRKNENGIVPYRFTAGEDARERGRAGGKKSGEARRKKRAMKEVASMVLNLNVDRDDVTALCDMLGIDPKEANVQLISLLAIANNAMQGDIKALEFLRDTAGEKPESW